MSQGVLTGRVGFSVLVWLYEDGGRPPKHVAGETIIV